MSEVAPLWLGVFGAVTGMLGLLTAIASAWYTRRQAIAAEGPLYPNVEVANHGWDENNPGWYQVSVIVRNRTDDAWEVTHAKAGRFGSEPIFPDFSRPFIGESYDPKLIPLNEISKQNLPRTAALNLAVGPLGTQHHHGWGGDSVRVNLFLRPSAFSSLTKRLCIVLSLDARTERVRHKDIAIIRRLKPNTITPA